MAENMDSEIDANEKMKIKLPKDNGKSETVVRGSVNGQAYEIAVNQEVEVPRAIYEAIANSGAKVEVVDEGANGLSTSSTAPLTDTATRQEPNIKPEGLTGSNPDAPIPTLEGGDGDTGHGAAPAAAPATEPEFNAGQTNAEGQGVAAQGGPRVGNDTTEKASATEGDKSEAKSDEHSDAKGEDKKDDEHANESVADLKARIAKIDDIKALEAEHQAETDGRGRTTALAALDHRIDELKQAS